MPYAIMARGSTRGFYPEPTKSLWVVAPGNVARAEKRFWGLRIRVVTGHRYLGGYIRDGEAEREWLRDKIQGWTESVKILAGVALKQPQSAYAGVQKSLQQEWAFMQRLTLGVGDDFDPVEVGLKEIFVPALFQSLREGVPEQGITPLPVKQVGMALSDPS